MLRSLATIALVLATGVFVLLAFGAIHYQLLPPLRGFAIAALCIAALSILWLRGNWGWLLLAVSMAVSLSLYHTIRPSNDRDWAPDVSRTVTGVRHGNFVTLSDVRDFVWQTRDQGTERWVDLTVNLDDIQTVDLFNSTWSSPLIAHTLISFGLRNGNHIVFSGEIRREKGEVFSTYGGFFRRYELALIAATERDIIFLRTNARREDVSLFPLDVTPAEAREMFLAYVAMGNRLHAKPEFYNTLTANCTTIIWQLAHTVDGRLPFDWRILVSGRLPDYLIGRGLLYSDAPRATILEDARISGLAQAEAKPDRDYSTVIRSGKAQNLRPKP